jgi:hypothetical protein
LEIAKHAIQENNIMLNIYSYQSASVYRLNLHLKLERTNMDKVYQLFAHGRWFSSGTPASSNTKTGRHDIAEILLKVAYKTSKIK